MCLYLARSCGDTCVGKAIKTLPLRKAELHFLSRSRETLIRATAVKIVQWYRKRRTDLVNKERRKKKHLKFPCDSPDSTWQGWCEIETRMIKMAHGGTVHSKICLGYWAEKLKENWKAIFQKPPCWRSLKQSTEQLLSVISQYHQQVVSSSQWQVVITSFNAGSPLLDHWVSNCATLSEKTWSETKLN